MSNSLKDQLLGLGFKKSPQPEHKPMPAQKPKFTPNPNQKSKHKSVSHSKSAAVRNPAESLDLGKAFALRSQHEKREREASENAKQEMARQKKLAKESVAKLIEGQVLNAANADIARHFSYAGKIKRLYVTAEQLNALNAGELGIVQHNGRYCLTSKDIVLAVRDLLPALVALYCDGNEEILPEGYDDAKFQVPDDLIW